MATALRRFVHMIDFACVGLGVLLVYASAIVPIA